MTRAVAIHGIKACDTMKTARTCLDTDGVACQFHDGTVEGAGRDCVENWARAVG